MPAHPGSPDKIQKSSKTIVCVECVCYLILLLPYFRQQTTATELREARDRINFLEKENTALFADIAELRESAKKASDADALRRKVTELTDRVAQLESGLAASKTEVQLKTREAEAAQEEAAVLRDLRQSLQEEVRRLQEKSM